MSWEERAEFFPMQRKAYDAMVSEVKRQRLGSAVSENLARARHGLAFERPPVPSSVYTQRAFERGTEGWAQGGEHDLWWQSVIDGRRREKYTVRGPFGQAGLFVGPLIGASVVVV